MVKLFSIFKEPIFSGQMTLLNYPYPRNIEEPNVYDTIRVHAEFSTATDTLRGPEFSVSLNCELFMFQY